MSQFIVEGGRPLSGTIRPAGNKNELQPVLAACLLTDEEITLKNVPDTKDREVFLALMRGIGVTVEEPDSHTLKVCAASLNSTSLNKDLCRQVRGGFMFSGPLLARHGSDN